MNFDDIDLDTVDPYNCGLSDEAARKFAVQIELARVLQKHYPDFLTGKSAPDSFDAMRDLAMVTGSLLASVRVTRNAATFEFVFKKYMEMLAKNTDAISNGAAEELKRVARSLH